MILIQNNLPRNVALADVINDPRVVAKLREMGFSLGQHANPDFVFELSHYIRQPIMPNTVVFDHVDGCGIRDWKLYNDPNVTAFVKMYRYTENSDLPKLRLGPSYLHWHRHDDLFNRPLVDYGRSVDVSFVGEMYSNRPETTVAIHRAGCVAALKKISGVNAFVSGSRHTFDRNGYLDHLFDTKVCVSPWGNGEPCHRDYEALAMGCEVVKPRGLDIECNPDIYNDSHFHWCMPDWSNLEEVIRYALGARWYEKKNTGELQDRLRKYRSPEWIAKFVVEAIQ